PVHHDPLGAQLKVRVICKGELAVDRETSQRRRTDVEDHFLTACNLHLVTCARHLPTRPGGTIRPARRLRRRSGMNDSRYADEQECWKKQCRKERAVFFSHEHQSPVLEDDPVIQRRRIARLSAGVCQASLTIRWSAA